MAIKTKMTPTRTPQKESRRQMCMRWASKTPALAFKPENTGPFFVALNYAKDVFEFPYPTLEQYSLGENDIIKEEWQPLSTVTPDRAAYRANSKGIEFRSEQSPNCWLWRSDLKRWVEDEDGDFPALKNQPPLPHPDAIMNATIWQDRQAWIRVGVSYGRKIDKCSDDSAPLVLDVNAVMNARIWQDSNNRIHKQIVYEDEDEDDFG